MKKHPSYKEILKARDQLFAEMAREKRIGPTPMKKKKTFKRRSAQDIAHDLAWHELGGLSSFAGAPAWFQAAIVTAAEKAILADRRQTKKWKVFKNERS